MSSSLQIEENYSQGDREVAQVSSSKHSRYQLLSTGVAGVAEAGEGLTPRCSLRKVHSGKTAKRCVQHPPMERTHRIKLNLCSESCRGKKKNKQILENRPGSRENQDDIRTSSRTR